MITPNSELNYRSPPPKKSRQVSLQTRLLSIVLPTIMGTVALSSLLSYRLIHQTAREEVKQQLENQTILARDILKSLPQDYIDPVADNLLSTGIKNSSIVQIISADRDNAIGTITSEGLSLDREIIGGVDVAQIASSILLGQN